MNKPFVITATIMLVYIGFTLVLLTRFSPLITEYNITSIFLIAVTGLLAIAFSSILFYLKANKPKPESPSVIYDNTAQQAAYLEKMSLEKTKMDRDHYFKLLDKAIAADDLPGVNKENIRAIFEKLQTV